MLTLHKKGEVFTCTEHMGNEGDGFPVDNPNAATTPQYPQRKSSSLMDGASTKRSKIPSSTSPTTIITTTATTTTTTTT